MTREKIDLDLKSLVTFLVVRGTEASAATLVEIAKAAKTGRGTKSSAAIRGEMVKGAGKKITDDHWRATLYFRQAGILAAAVKNLETFFTHPDADMQDCHIRDYRLHTLFEALASAAVLARRCVDDEIADQLLNREHERAGAAKARKGVSDKTQPRDQLILDLAREFRFLSSNKKQDRRGTVAREVFKDKRLTESEEWKAKPMGLGGVDAVVRKHWRRLSPSLPTRAKNR
jgi:hypothetical protein